MATEGGSSYRSRYHCGGICAPQLRGLAKKTKDGPEARRLLTLAAICDGATRTEAAKIGDVGLQIIREVQRAGPDGSAGRKTARPALQAQ
jgi:hypothetical protein